MNTATGRTESLEDFQRTKTFAAAPDAVFSALTDIDALTGWWTPAGGGADAGETLRFLMGDQEVVMRVDEADRPSRVRWSVLVCEAAPDWVGTSITFDLEPVGAGTELRFRHHGLNPRPRVLRDLPRRVDALPRQPRRLRRPGRRQPEPARRRRAVRRLARRARRPLSKHGRRRSRSARKHR